MNPELKNPMYAAGTILAGVGGLMMMTILLGLPDWVCIAGFILWAIGIAILIVYEKRKANADPRRDPDK